MYFYKSVFKQYNELSTKSMDLRNKTIAIVEDDLPSLKYYETLLKNTGAEVRTFQNGKLFVEYFAIHGGRPDMVIIDFLIPLVNGIDCIRLFRKERKSVPVLMITGYCSEQTKTEAYIAGCNEFILKPVPPEKVFFLIGKYFGTEVLAH